MAKVESFFQKLKGEKDDIYLERVASFVARMFGGYSILHVNGRFRAGDIITREDAGRLAAQDGHYLVDETTAVVRFIIPCQDSKKDDGVEFDLDFTPQPTASIGKEVSQIRKLFFFFFVEAVAGTIQGEDAIWLLETSPVGRRLYTLERG